MNKNVVLATFFLLAGTLITTVIATAQDAEARRGGNSPQNIENNDDNKIKIDNEAEHNSNAQVASCNFNNVQQAGYDCADDFKNNVNRDSDGGVG